MYWQKKSCEKPKKKKTMMELQLLFPGVGVQSSDVYTHGDASVAFISLNILLARAAVPNHVLCLDLMPFSWPNYCHIPKKKKKNLFLWLMCFMWSCPHTSTSHEPTGLHPREIKVVGHDGKSQCVSVYQPLVVSQEKKTSTCCINAARLF